MPSLLPLFFGVLFSWFQPSAPAFKGGERSLNQFISQNIVYPDYSLINCLQGTVMVSFKVTRSGKVFDSSVMKGYQTDLDKEALRIVRLSSGKWIVPASFDTTRVVTLPIRFTLTDYQCEERSGEAISASIAAYKAREGLTRAVMNFYDKKSTGQYSQEDEQRILELKVQLGYDDKFVGRMIRRANTKLKQGDRESACEDFTFVKRIGSSAADASLLDNCGKK